LLRKVVTAYGGCGALRACSPGFALRGRCAPLPARGYVDDGRERPPAGSLRSARGQPCWTSWWTGCACPRAWPQGLPTGYPAFDHIPTGSNCAACGLAPSIFLIFSGEKPPACGLRASLAGWTPSGRRVKARAATAQRLGL